MEVVVLGTQIVITLNSHGFSTWSYFKSLILLLEMELMGFILYRVSLQILLQLQQQVHSPQAVMYLFNVNSNINRPHCLFIS